MNFHKIIYKAACIKKKKTNEKNIFIQMQGYYGRKQLQTNIPWESVFKNNKDFIFLNAPKMQIDEKRSKFI